MIGNKNSLPQYTRSQLALRNGQDKPQVWVAFNGLIYDVSHSRLWKNGKHYEHWAGQDLTDELADAPHTEKVFDRFPVIGRLVNSKNL
ncbi:MAG: cytochrome b5 [Cyclobacteriaceae bacterium]|nr:cytochrome b5 [Cyclobacteriaceae bacterium]